MNFLDFDKVIEYDINNLIEIEDWNKEECVELRTLNSNNSIGKIINILCHNLTNVEKTLIHKYYNDNNIYKTNIKLVIYIILQILNENNIIFTNLTFGYLVDTLKISYKKNNITFNPKCLNYIKSWILIIRSYYINKSKFELLKINNIMNIDIDNNLLEIFNQDLWLNKFSKLINLFKKPFIKILTCSFYLTYINNDNNIIIKSLINTHTELNNQIDYIMIILISLLYYYGLSKYNITNEKFYIYKDIELNELLIYKHNNIKKFFIDNSSIIDFNEIENNPIYFNIFYLILKDIKINYLKPILIKEIIKHLNTKNY